MEPVQQPVNVGEWTYDMRGSGGSEQFKAGSYYLAKDEPTVRLTVPPGFKFVVTNMTTNKVSIKFDTLKIDGVQIWESGSPMGNKYKSTTYERDKWFFDDSADFLVEDYVEFGHTGGTGVWWHIMGWFIPADGTRESEIMREEYLAAEAERLASMPVTEEAPDE